MLDYTLKTKHASLNVDFEMTVFNAAKVYGLNITNMAAIFI